MDEYIEALEKENKALKRETDFIKSIKDVVGRMVDARAERRHWSAVRALIAAEKQNKQYKKMLKDAGLL